MVDMQRGRLANNTNTTGIEFGDTSSSSSSSGGGVDGSSDSTAQQQQQQGDKSVDDTSLDGEEAEADFEREL
jgi:hypothetical protein